MNNDSRVEFHFDRPNSKQTVEALIEGVETLARGGEWPLVVTYTGSGSC